MTNAHASPVSRSPRRFVLRVLAAGSFASLGLAMASHWVPPLAWVGVVVALAAGVVALEAGRREFAAWRARAQAEAAAERADHRERTRQLHARQREVLAVVDARAKALHVTLGDTKASLGATRVSLGEARQQVSSLRGDNAALLLENDSLKVENSSLKVENTDLRTRLETLAEASAEAEVVALPRRRAVDEGSEWDVLETPTVVDLDLQRLASPFVAEVQRRYAN